jgi:hypothetical protein
MPASCLQIEGQIMRYVCLFTFGGLAVFSGLAAFISDAGYKRAKVCGWRLIACLQPATVQHKYGKRGKL